MLIEGRHSTDGSLTEAVKSTNNAAHLYDQTAHAGHDPSIDRIKVEQQNSYARVTADGVVKGVPGFLKKVICESAGTLALVDSTATGTAFFTFAFSAGQVIEFDCLFTLGLFAEWTSGTFVIVYR